MRPGRHRASDISWEESFSWSWVHRQSRNQSIRGRSWKAFEWLSKFRHALTGLPDSGRRPLWSFNFLTLWHKKLECFELLRRNKKRSSFCESRPNNGLLILVTWNRRSGRCKEPYSFGLFQPLVCKFGCDKKILEIKVFQSNWGTIYVNTKFQFYWGCRLWNEKFRIKIFFEQN